MNDWCPYCETQTVSLNRCKKCKHTFGGHVARPPKRKEKDPFPSFTTEEIKDLRKKD